MKEQTGVCTAHLTLIRCQKTADPGAAGNDPPVFLPPLPEGGEGAELIRIVERKSGRTVGAVHCTPTGDAVEIDLSVAASENAERSAAEALKGSARLIFRSGKKIKKIETWLDPSLPAIRALEKAGFERVFEKDGVVRYEKKRPTFPALVVSMILFTLLGVLVGFLTGNFPLWIAIGIAAGILPGALIEDLLKKRAGNGKRKKKNPKK